jgi:hypothetical protein
MSTINRLSSVDALQPGDLIPVWDGSNGDTRKASMSTLLAFIEANFADPDHTTRIVAPNADGFNVDIGNTGDSFWLIINPASNYTSGSVTLPSAAFAVNDQEVTVVVTAQVVSFSVTSSGATVQGAPTQLAIYDSFRVRYNAAQLTWYVLDSTNFGEAGYADVLDFGAVGDGVADDTAAIQAAVDYAITNANLSAMVVFPASYRFKITSVNVISNVPIQLYAYGAYFTLTSPTTAGFVIQGAIGHRFSGGKFTQASYTSADTCRAFDLTQSVGYQNQSVIMTDVEAYNVYQFVNAYMNKTAFPNSANYRHIFTRCMANLQSGDPDGNRAQIITASGALQTRWPASGSLITPIVPGDNNFIVLYNDSGATPNTYFSYPNDYLVDPSGDFITLTVAGSAKVPSATAKVEIRWSSWAGSYGLNLFGDVVGDSAGNDTKVLGCEIKGYHRNIITNGVSTKVHSTSIDGGAIGIDFQGTSLSIIGCYLEYSYHCLRYSGASDVTFIGTNFSPLDPEIHYVGTLVTGSTYTENRFGNIGSQTTKNAGSAQVFTSGDGIPIQANRVLALLTGDPRLAALAWQGIDRFDIDHLGDVTANKGTVSIPGYSFRDGATQYKDTGFYYDSVADEIVVSIAASNKVYLGDKLIRLGNAGPEIRQGSGSPEGVVTAVIGSTFQRTDGGAGTSFYVKESGAGNTGWVGK